MTRLRWPKAILLDLDDTILTFDSVSDASWMVVLHRHSDRFGSMGVQTIFQAKIVCQGILEGSGTASDRAP